MTRMIMTIVTALRTPTWLFSNVNKARGIDIMESKRSDKQLPLRVFMWEIAILRMVSLSGFRARVLQVGTMSQSSFM